MNPELVKKQKTQFVKHLVTSLDCLVCAQLIIIYLHDVSMLRLIMGAVVQLSFLSPWFLGAQVPVRVPLTLDRRHIIATILAYSGLCMAVHIFTELPKPLSGNYLHGGLTIEFVGTRALTSRWPLIVWDFMVLVLQLTAFSIYFPAPKKREPSADAANDAASEYTVGSEGSDVSASALDEMPAANPYSGQMVVQTIGIGHTLAAHWEHGEHVARQAQAEAAAAEATSPSSTPAMSVVDAATSVSGIV